MLRVHILDLRGAERAQDSRPCEEGIWVEGMQVDLDQISVSGNDHRKGRSLKLCPDRFCFYQRHLDEEFGAIAVLLSLELWELGRVCILRQDRGFRRRHIGIAVDIVRHAFKDDR